MQPTPSTPMTGKPINDLLMYATHDAFRRDLGRFHAAAINGQLTAPGVRAGWENFKAQLLLHHRVEDEELWPRLRRAVAGRRQDVALIDDMDAEHALIDPLLDAVDTALSKNADVVTHVEELIEALGHHLAHEEEQALPLIQSRLSPADWKAFTDGMRRHQGVKGAAVYVPWVIDGRPAERRTEILAVFPPPLRAVNSLIWEPKYRKRGLWATA